MKFHSFVCATAVAMAACGGVGIDDFQEKLGEAFCKNAVECGQAPDQASCEAALQLESRFFETVVAKAKAKVITYDSGLGSDCIDSYATAGCAFTGFHSDTDDPCADMFVGTVAVGGACTISLECANQGICEATDPNCDPDVTCCPGTCMATPAAVPIGGNCATAPCETGYCSSVTDICTVPLATAGAACTDFDACANPMYCNVFAASPTCVAPAARGATCDPNMLLPCIDSRDYCDALTTKCTPNVAVGQACGGTNEANCIGYADCGPSMTCVAFALAGAACPTGDDSACLGDLDCPSGTCTLPPAQAACSRIDDSDMSEPPVSSPELRSTARTLGDPMQAPWLRRSKR